MKRNRKLLFAKIAVVMGVIPILLWAYEFGPDAGFSGVPNEGNCTAAGCHVGTANDPANKGSVSVAFPNGQTYTPGVKQHLVVTIADPAQHAWGFQLTVRQASSTNTTAGTLASTDANTTMMCATSNFVGQQEVPFSSARTQTCPAIMTLQYLEHSLTGYTASKGRSTSQTYEFDWTPPATSSGNVTVYVAGNAANADLSVNGDHIYTTSFTLTPPGASNTPAITAGGVVSAAGFQAGIVPGSYVTITGTNLSPVALDTWDKTIVDGKLPTSLDGVSVSIGGKPAFIYVVTPTQINLQAPDVGTGPVPVTVTTPSGTSAPVTANVLAQSPAFFLWPGSQPVTTRVDGSFAVKAGTFATLATLAAKPGDVLIFWGTGFGPTDPPLAAGILAPASPLSFTSPVSIKIGTVNVQAIYSILSPPFAGLNQIAITLPDTLADGDYPITATVSGATSPDGVTISVKK